MVFYDSFPFNIQNHQCLCFKYRSLLKRQQCGSMTVETSIKSIIFYIFFLIFFFLVFSGLTLQLVAIIGKNQIKLGNGTFIWCFFTRFESVFVFFRNVFRLKALYSDCYCCFSYGIAIKLISNRINTFKEKLPNISIFKFHSKFSNATSKEKQSLAYAYLFDSIHILKHATIFYYVQCFFFVQLLLYADISEFIPISWKTTVFLSYCFYLSIFAIDNTLIAHINNFNTNSDKNNNNIFEYISLLID